jgi:two-component system, OmpR family, phosphate regulon sensor histidine kinase PhoR
MFYKYIFSFRKKMLLTHISLFLICLALIFPFVEGSVDRIVHHSLEQRASELIGKIQKAPNLDSMIEYLRTEKAFVFSRITLFDHEGNPIYDTLASDAEEQQKLNDDRYEVIKALKYGRAYGNRYSTVFRQSIVYAALSFESQEQEYVLRIGLPFAEIRALSHDFEIGFLTLGAIILLLYGLMIWIIIHHLSRPIQQIITMIRPYQEGKEEFLPRIQMGKEIQPKNEFGKLAQTLNALNERIQKQIANLVEQRERTQEILESLGEGVIAVDVDGLVTFANRSACNMLGSARDSFLNQKIKEINARRPGLRERCQELIELALERAEVTVETCTVEEAQKYYFDLIAAPLAQHNGVILVLQDKTSDYEVIEMGKDFIANASHELRTPITIIRGFAETLHDHPQFSAAQTQEITEKILKTCLRLDTLVKSLLTLADIENLSEEQFRPVDLIAVSENCKRMLLVAHPLIKMSMHTKIEEATISADPDLLEMAVMNLLENAVKYSPVPAQIDMMVESAGEYVQLSVKDRGIGIPATDLPHIFGRFYTVDKARSRKFGGTGLGLSIVKTILQKHRGEVTVVSQLGQGTTFSIRLPKAF